MCTWQQMRTWAQQSAIHPPRNESVKLTDSRNSCNVQMDSKDGEERIQGFINTNSRFDLFLNFRYRVQCFYALELHTVILQVTLDLFVVFVVYLQELWPLREPRVTWTRWAYSRTWSWNAERWTPGAAAMVSSFIITIVFFNHLLINSMAYGTRRFNVSFTKAL